MDDLIRGDSVMSDSGPHGWSAPNPNTRQEAVERAYDRVRNQDDTDFGGLVEWVIDASGLLEANNQLRQRLTEAEGLLALLADNLRAQKWPSEWCESLAEFDAYRTKYTPELPE